MSCEDLARGTNSNEVSESAHQSAGLNERLANALTELAMRERCPYQLKSLLWDLRQGRFSAEEMLRSVHCGALLQAVCCCSFTEQVTAEEFYEYKEEDFSTTREIIALAVPFVLEVLSTEALSMAVTVVQQVVDDFVLLAAMNGVRQVWNTDSVVACISDALTVIMRLLKCLSTADLICYTSEACRIAPAKSIAAYLRDHLHRQQWKRWPGAQAAFVWLVGQLGFPAMSEYIDTLVPASLLFIDDYVLDNKITGVQCLQRVMEHCGRTELTWHDRASVIYQALLHLTYTRESSLVAVLYPCLLRILDVLERCPPFDEESSVGRHDIVFERLLDEMYTEDKIALRQAYASNLSPFVSRMGVYSIRHLKKLLMVVTSYLELGDSPEEISRTHVLVALQQLLRCAWPRLSAPHHVMSLMTSLAKLLIDVSLDSQQSAAAVAGGTSAMMQEAGRCLVMLARCSDVARSSLSDLRQAAMAEERELDLAAEVFGEALLRAAMPD